MFLTNVLLKKVKSKHVMVLLQSTGSNYKLITFRERTEEKKEILFFDPRVERVCVFKEIHRLKGLKKPLNLRVDKNEHTYGIIPEHLLEQAQKQEHK